MGNLTGSETEQEDRSLGIQVIRDAIDQKPQFGDESTAVQIKEIHCDVVKLSTTEDDKRRSLFFKRDALKFSNDRGGKALKKDVEMSLYCMLRQGEKHEIVPFTLVLHYSKVSSKRGPFWSDALFGSIVDIITAARDEAARTKKIQFKLVNDDLNATMEFMYR